MNKSTSKFSFSMAIPIINQSFPWILFILGLWLVVIKPFGPHWEFVPGDLGDARFNNYVLEHFFHWISGAEASFWDAPFFFPFKNVIAFSDNLLGSAPFYAGLRWMGLDRETAFQGWYLLGFCLNFLAAAWVLSRFKLHPLAVSVGAFFFTFGIPLLAQESHPQLFYRFGIPLVCYFLGRFFEDPKISHLAALVFWLVWQFYLTIYIGFFLLLLLAVLIVLAPFLEPIFSIRSYFIQWPRKIHLAWVMSSHRERIVSFLVTGGSIFCLMALLYPYYKASNDYGFFRDWVTVSAMLPTPASYLLSDNSLLWKAISDNFSGISMRWEHQLFAGMAISLLMAIGTYKLFRSNHNRQAKLYFWSMILLVLITLNLNGFSVYRLIWNIPGFNSIRAVTRIELVLMWPQAFLASWGLNGILRYKNQKSYWKYGQAFFLIAIMVAESVFFTQTNYSKSEGLVRLENLRKSITEVLPNSPILSFAYTGKEPAYMSELDAMLLTQQMGWSTLNGYSGNTPQGYDLPAACDQIPNQVKKYFKFVNMDKEQRNSFYLASMKRIVPIGFSDCNPAWWKKMP